NRFRCASSIFSFSISTSRLSSSACCSITRRFKLSMSFGSSTVFAAFAMRKLYAHDVRRARQLQRKERLETLHRELRCLRSNRTSPVDAFKQHRQLCLRQIDGAVLGTRPHEATALEPLREQAQPVTVPPEDLHTVAAATAEDEELAREWIFSQLQLHQRREPIEALALMRCTA